MDLNELIREHTENLLNAGGGTVSDFVIRAVNDGRFRRHRNELVLDGLRARARNDFRALGKQDEIILDEQRDIRLPCVLVIPGRDEDRNKRKWIYDCTPNDLEDAIDLRRQQIKSDNRAMKQLRKAHDILLPVIGPNGTIADYMRGGV